MRRGPHGILLVDKPEGPTSAAIVRDVKRRLCGAKVGHLGTLDPFATGLLPLCVGEGSKIVPFLNQEEKGYEGRLRLGIATDTLDSTGAEVERRPVPPFDDRVLAGVAARLTGSISQIPPMFSALKRQGVPLYRLARRGETVERAPRTVVIHSLHLRRAGAHEIELAVRCSSGTYVRVLGADVASTLGSVGHLTRLRRTSFGSFDLANAVSYPLPETEALPLLPLRLALGHLRERTIAPPLEREVRAGRQVALRALGPPHTPGEVVKLIGADGELAAIVESRAEGWRILRVFNVGGGDPPAPSLDSP